MKCHFASYLFENTPRDEECVLFLDNLDSHLTPEFLAGLRAANCFRFLFPPNRTDEVQTVDAGLGY